jgi:hypothetical protein
MVLIDDQQDGDMFAYFLLEMLHLLDSLLK